MNNKRRDFYLLTFFCVMVIASMTALCAWASVKQPLWAIPGSVTRNPWFIVTLADAYFGFLFFSVWVWIREPNKIKRWFWLIAILLLGNLAAGVFTLIQLIGLKEKSDVKGLFQPPNDR